VAIGTGNPASFSTRFLGAGTVAVVAERLNRRWVGIELNPDYGIQTEKRIQADKA
jgi:DNA modification methylase